MSEIRRGRDKIHGAHKDDPQWREWVKLYLDGEKIGEFEPDHMEALHEAIKYATEEMDISWLADLCGLAEALESLWMEGDDNG